MMKQKKLTSFFNKSAKIIPESYPSNTNTVPIKEMVTIPHSGVLGKSQEQIEPSANISYCMMFDGCSKGNPGPAGAGAVIYANNAELWAKAIYVGHEETNNIAEYTGLLLGMNEAIFRKIRVLLVKGDSELVIKQMQGKYKVKSENLLDIYQEAKELEKQFDKIEYMHVYRHLNARADALSNEGLEKKGKYGSNNMLTKFA